MYHLSMVLHMHYAVQDHVTPEVGIHNWLIVRMVAKLLTMEVLRDVDGSKHGGEDIIVDSDMDCIELDGDGFHGKGGHRAGVGGDTKDW